MIQEGDSESDILFKSMSDSENSMSDSEPPALVELELSKLLVMKKIVLL